MSSSCSRHRLLATVSLLVLTVNGSAIADEKDAVPKSIRVLFVGNSQIFYNDLPKILETLAESAPKDRPRIKAERAVFGGASLESHWNKGDGKDTARGKIAAEKWDYVILQEIYYGKPEPFNKYARLFHDLIQQHGAKTVLYCTASINQDYPQGFEALHDMHIALGKELKVPVAAAGKAWRTYWGENPAEEARLDLYHADKAHPGWKGSYLSACTLYALLTGQSPVGLTHRLPGQPEETLSPAQAKRFQEAAWQVHQEINGKD
jgi:hypothetical protein